MQWNRAVVVCLGYFCFITSLLSAKECADVFVDIQTPTAASEVQRRLFLDFSLYMLNGFSPDRSCRLADDAQSIVCRELSIAFGAQEEQRLSLKFSELRDWYQRNWLNGAGACGHTEWVSPTVADLEAKLNFRTWPQTVIARSAIKQTKRVIYRSPAGHPLQMSVAETIDVIAGIETPGDIEVAIQNHKSGQDYEFYVYDKSGKLSPIAVFPVGPRSAPSICLACHMDPATGHVTRFLPPLPKPL